MILEQEAERPRLAKVSVAAAGQPESSPAVVMTKAVLMLALRPGVLHDVSLAVDVTLEVEMLDEVVVVEEDEYDTTADCTPSTADLRLVSNSVVVVCS